MKHNIESSRAFKGAPPYTLHLVWGHLTFTEIVWVEKQLLEEDILMGNFLTGHPVLFDIYDKNIHYGLQLLPWSIEDSTFSVLNGLQHLNTYLCIVKIELGACSMPDQLKGEG